MSVVRENETHPTLHEDEAADLVVILQEEANRTSQALSDAWGADRFEEVERLGHWLIRIQLLLTAFGRSDIAKKFTAHGLFTELRVLKPPEEKKP